MTRKHASAHVLLRPLIEGQADTVQAAARRVRDEDAEAVHDSRVAIRRLRCALRASRGLYGERPVRALEVELRRHGRALGGLRDAEVLEETLHAALPSGEAPDPIVATLGRWLEERRTHERDLRGHAVALLGGGELDACLGALRALLARGARRDRAILPLAREQLDLTEAAVMEVLPGKKLVRSAGFGRGSDALFHAMHVVRIRCKRRRYTAEIFAQLMDVVSGSGAPPRLCDRAGARAIRYAIVAEQAALLQRELGHLQDAHATLTAIRADLALEGDARTAALGALGSLRAQLLERALADLARQGYV